MTNGRQESGWEKDAAETVRKEAITMHHLTTFEMVSGCIIFFLAICVIIIMIIAGAMLAADAKIKENERNVNRKAERMARDKVKQMLSGCQIQITQRISVVEDDLTGR